MSGSTPEVSLGSAVKGLPLRSVRFTISFELESHQELPAPRFDSEDQRALKANTITCWTQAPCVQDGRRTPTRSSTLRDW